MSKKRRVAEEQCSSAGASLVPGAMSSVTGMESMSVAPRLSRAVQKLERWALHQQSKGDEPIAWDKINPRTDLKVLPYNNIPRILDDNEKCKVLLDKLIVVKLCGTLGRSLGTTQPKC